MNGRLVVCFLFALVVLSTQVYAETYFEDFNFIDVDVGYLLKAGTSNVGYASVIGELSSASLEES